MNPWRIAGWSAAALVLLTPLVAMQFTDEVDWTLADFAFAAFLLLSVGIPMELVVRKSGSAAYRAAAGVGLLALFLLVWVNGAVGLIGSESNRANLMYAGVLAAGILGAIIARLRPHGMAVTLFAMASLQALIAVIALVAKLGAPVNGAREILGVNACFAFLFVGSGLLFLKAAQKLPEQSPA